MRYLCILLFLIISKSIFPSTYYVSVNGSDTNSGTSVSSPWKTIDKVNSFKYNFSNGDEILFEKNGVYKGSLSIGRSNIIISSYGSGDKPIFTGSERSTNWVVHSGSIWKVPVTSNVNYVYQNNELLPLARYPNTGWLRNDIGTDTQINDSELTQPSNYWNGSRLVVRGSAWCYNTSTISSYSPGVLNFPTIDGYYLDNRNWGYFLCNKLSELDSPGEWFWDSTTNLLYLWPKYGSDPNTLDIEYCVRQSGINIDYNQHGVTISDISIKNYNDILIDLAGNNNVTIDNCKLSHARRGIYIYGNGTTIINSVMEDVYATGVFVTLGDNNTIESNIFSRIGDVPGLGESGWGYFGIRSAGLGNIIRKNKMYDIGYIAIAFGQNTLVEKNFIENACSILSDGSGISFDNVDGAIIRNNIVVSTLGNTESCASNYSGCDPKGKGIYFGNTYLRNTVVDSNTVAFCNGAGIWVDHTTFSIGNQITNNSLFGNSLYQIGFSDYSNAVNAPPPYIMQEYNDVVTGNILYSLDQYQYSMYHINRWTSNIDFGTFDNNKYYNFWNNQKVSIETFLPGYSYNSYTLDQWRSIRGDDVNSISGPYDPSSPQSDHLLVYNEYQTSGSFNIPPGTWSDVYGSSYSGSVYLTPYSSKILFKTSDSQYLNCKVFLTGPMNWNTLRMGKYLNVPTNNPYDGLGIPNDSDPMSIGQDSIVDWVLLQLIDDQNQIIESRSFLLKTDGSICDPLTGSLNLEFQNSFIGKNLIVRHRNHLGVMYTGGIQNGMVIDLTNTPSIYGSDPTYLNNNIRSLWPGDVLFDNNVKYTGTNNDRDAILTRIGGIFPTNTIQGYYNEDVNMDGIVKYTGIQNDRDVILIVVGGIPTGVKNAQLP